MTVDIRAKIRCNLGKVIEASLSDDLLSEAAIIRTTGDITIAGLKSFARGMLVEIAYEQSHRGTVTRFPRTLRVIRSTADPYQNITRVEVGCKLALGEQIKQPDVFYAAKNPPDWWTGTVKPVYQVGTELPDGDNTENYTTSWPPPPISARKLLEYCLRKIGIKKIRGAGLLTFYFMKSKLELDSGYLSIVGDLLISHCLYGRLNQKEEFVIEPIQLFKPAAGPTVRDADLISLEPINNGNEPAGSVLVTYNAIQAPGSR